MINGQIFFVGIIEIRTGTAKWVYRHRLIGSPMKISTAECTYYYKITAKEKKNEKEKRMFVSQAEDTRSKDQYPQ